MVKIDMQNAVRETASGGGAVRATLLGSVASLGLAVALLAPSAAQAQSVDACGPATDGKVTCAPAGNPFEQGVYYNLAGSVPPLDLEIALQSGLEIQLSPTAAYQVALGAYGANGGMVRISGADNTSINTTRPGDSGVVAVSYSGGIAVDLDRVDSAGLGIFGVTYGGGTVSISANDVNTAGTGSTGIVVNGRDTILQTTAEITAGNVTTTGNSADGIRFVDRAGGIVRIVSTGSIVTTGTDSRGILVGISAAGGPIRPMVDIRVNDITTSGSGGVGINTTGRDIQIQVDGTIRTSGLNAHGILIGSPVGANAPRVILNGAIETSGAFARGIAVNTVNGASITGDGTIDTTGPFAAGIYGVGTNARGDTVVDLSRITTSGVLSDAVFLSGTSNADDMAVSVDDISTTGGLSRGAVLFTQGNAAFQSSGSVSTTEYGSSGIVVRAGGAAIVDVNNVSVLGDNADTIVARGRSATVTISGTVSSAGTAQEYYYPATVFARAVDGTSPEALADPANGAATVVNNGLVTSLANGVRGIASIGNNVAAVMGTGSVVTSGDGATGIEVRSRGDVLVQQDSVVTNGAAGGILAQTLGDTGRVAIDVGSVETRSTATGGTPAIGIETFALDGVTAISAGSVSTAGEGATGIRATSRLGEIGIDVGSVKTSGDYASGVSVTSTAGPVSINARSIETQGLGSTGIRASSSGGSVLVVAGDVKTHGAYAGGVSAFSFYGDGATVLSGGTISTEGAYSTGVSVQSAYGLATAVVNNVSATGGHAGAVRANGAAARVVVSGDIVSTGAGIGDRPAAVNAIADTPVGLIDPPGVGTAGVVNNGTVTASGANNRGIFVRGTNAATISGTGSASSNGTGSRALAASSTGNISIEQARATATGADDVIGVIGSSYGATGNVSINVGTVKVTQTGAPTLGSVGILASVLRGTASVTTDSVTVTGDLTPGILATSSERGTVIVKAGTVSTNGAQSEGIYAGGQASRVDVTVAKVTTTGDSANGVNARVQSGNIAVDVGDVATLGRRAFGASAVSVSGGTVSVTQTGTVTTRGEQSYGVQSTTLDRTGSATTNAHDVTTSGARARAVIAVAGTAAVTVTGNVSTSGAASAGITAGAYHGNSSVVNSGRVATSGAGSDGIYAVATGNVSISGTGTIATSGEGSRGVWTESLGGNISVRQGAVSTTGIGSTAISARSGGGNVVLDLATVTTAGAGSSGVLAQATGLVDVRLAGVTTSGAGSTGVDLSGRAVSLTTSGPIVTSGAATNGQAAVSIQSATTANLMLGGDVISSGAGRQGVLVRANGAVTASVASGATITGASGALTILSGGDTTLTNAGTIGGRADQLITIAGGPARITNNGLIAGVVALSDQADTLTNNRQLILFGGAFGAGDDNLVNTGTTTLAGNVDFGAGTDRFTNSGLVEIATRSTPTAYVLAGLESFANSGRVSLVNGVAGDTLTLPGTFNGSGGSTLSLDVNLATPAADRLVVGGAATGSTAIQLNMIGAPLLTNGVTLVQGGAGTSAGAFTFGPVDRGLVRYGLAFDAAANRFNLVGAPSSAGLRLLKVSEGMQSAWQTSADAVFSQLDSGRYAAVAGQQAAGRFWLQMFGKLTRRGDIRTVSDFGFTRTVDLSTQQDAFGGQAGFGFGSGNAVFGITGGAQTSTLSFSRTAQRINYAAYNIGAYASVRAGSFYLNALGKYDLVDLTVKMPELGFRTTSDGKGYGGRVEAGFRLGSETFFVEPHAGIAYVRTDLDPLVVQGVSVAFDDMTGVRGSGGITLGGHSPIGGDRVLTYYVSGDAVHEFEGKDGVRFSTGTTAYGYRNDPLGTYGRGKLGITIDTGKVTGFIEGEGVYGSGYKGGGGRAGLRLRF